METIGIYIDGDNISHNIIQNLFKKVNYLGKIVSCKVFRDWSQEDSKKWSTVINEYKLEAIQCFRHAQKQSTDVHMITDIITDLFMYQNISTFIIATCDSDYNHVYQQILKQGKTLIIIGKDAKLSNIANQFWYYNDLLVEEKIISNKLKKKSTT